jgi:hypothetical protein
MNLYALKSHLTISDQVTYNVRKEVNFLISSEIVPLRLGFFDRLRTSKRDKFQICSGMVSTRLTLDMRLNLLGGE